MNDYNPLPNETTRKPPKKPKSEHHVQLPTPPPDPFEITHAVYPRTPFPDDDGEADIPEKEKENNECGTNERVNIFDYLDSLKGVYSSSASVFTPVIVTEEAFDQLEKLHKLIEQMLELREQNVKLQSRIHDLEHLNNLEKLVLHPELIDHEYPDLEKDTAFAQAILDSIMHDPKNKDLPKYKQSRSSILRRRRSGSTSDKPLSDSMIVGEKEERDKEHLESVFKHDKRSKVSKWTKVKAAFKWEKASNVGDMKSQDSGIHVPINYEIARYLRVPSTSDDLGQSPGDSGAGISTPGSISSASSNEDLTMCRHQSEDFRSSDDENPHQYIPHSKDRRRKSHSHKYPRTPWAKMKDIINTRHSLRKKHRLSAASDDIQIDVEFCSDNEDVFDDPGNKSVNLSPSPNVYSVSSTSPSGSDIPPEVFERYQHALAEDSTSDSESRSSRWTRVRKAFLATRDYPRRPNRVSQTSQGRDKSDNSVEDEIQRNYETLQKKLSLEFQEKISEWERLKQHSPGMSSSPTACGYADDNLDPFFTKKIGELQKLKSQSPTSQHQRIQMTREYDLPPDFKKKLQEWEKIKKSSQNSGSSRRKLGETKWKSLCGPRSSEQSPVFDYPPLSEEFRKKLEEWKQIKALGGPHTDHKRLKDKTPSPKLSRKNSSPKSSKKEKKESSKELHWFEKELTKIEKEKQRLERERQKFIEREERLSKLRKSILGGSPKKEVLIHTPSGFHRFEGISRKFTQKLYEWEKSQGIAPEASTFALLSSSSYSPKIVDVNGQRLEDSSARQSSILSRSKSADSVAISALNLTCPILSGQPSSLSLNDMDDLDKDCLADSKASSMQYLIGNEQHYLDESYDLDEPEAMLVEVEDYEEETAEPLHVFCGGRHQLPVYQRQEFKPLCESETIVVPKIRRSESARAQINYDLMEVIVKLLTELQVTEDEIRCLTENRNLEDQRNKKSYKFLNELQDQSLRKLTEQLQYLQEANKIVATNITTDEKKTHSNLDDILENVQDISDEMLLMTDEMLNSISDRLSTDTHDHQSTIFEKIKELRNRIADLRRHLSYICAATDVDKPPTQMSTNTRAEKSTSFQNQTKELSGSADEKDSRMFRRREETSTLNSSQGAVKKRIRYRQKHMNKSTEDTDDEEDPESSKNKRQHKKMSRTLSVSESSLPPQSDDTVQFPNPSQISRSEIRLESPLSESAVTLFVKTTRKLFITEAGLATSCVEGSSSGINGDKTCDESIDTNLAESRLETTSSLPPLPSSPVPHRKIYKEISPGIENMMEKYNQNLQHTSGVKSGGSSGSNSPVAWRSPVLDRRVRVQTEKYEECLSQKSSVQKSSSAIHLNFSKQTAPLIRKNSLNTDSMNTNMKKDETKRDLTLNIHLANSFGSSKHGELSPEDRMRKIQKAKEAFLKTPISAPSYISDESLQFPQRNRLSQISVDSESSHDLCSLPGSLLTKSVSAGMINVDPDVYSRINPEFRAEGYVSLPRQATKNKHGLLGGRSAFSTIASKFRKVKMRRGKDKDRNKEKQVVETLCRQSLVVNINDDGNIEGASGERFCSNNGNIHVELVGNDRPLSPKLSKSSSWIRKSLFRK